MHNASKGEPVNEVAPFAHVLHEERIAQMAHGPAFARGKKYVEEGRVKRLSPGPKRLTGEVAGTSTYEVSIWASGERLGYSCSCPTGQEGNFCKHCVAVALAWLDKKQRKSAEYTPKQGQYLSFIYYYTKLHRVAPAEADMRAYFGVTPPVVHDMVTTLERRGFIE